MLSKAMRFVRQREINKRMENEKKEEMARIASEKEQEVRAKKRAAAKAAADRRKARNAAVEEQAAVKQRRVTTYVNMVAHVSGAWRFRAMGELKSKKFPFWAHPIWAQRFATRFRVRQE